MKYLTNYGQHQICVVSFYNMRDEIEVTMNFGYFHRCDTTAFVFFARIAHYLMIVHQKFYSAKLVIAFCVL